MEFEQVPDVSTRELVKIVSGWGVQYSKDMKAAKEFACPCCDRFSFTRAGAGYSQEFFMAVVGYSRENPSSMTMGGFEGPNMYACGCLIVECPRCFEKSWIHLLDTSLRIMMVECPNWPVPTDPYSSG